jgi:hypothetical protein
MASQVILKKSSVAARVPVAEDLAFGELALNYADGILYYKKSDGTTIASISGGGGSSTPAAGIGATTSSVNSTNTYTTVIGFKLGEAIRPQSEVLVHCDCKSFEFKVSNMIGKDHSLLILKEMKPLKSSNTYNILMGCKHLIRLAQYIFERKHVFDK